MEAFVVEIGVVEARKWQLIVALVCLAGLLHAQRSRGQALPGVQPVQSCGSNGVLCSPGPAPISIVQPSSPGPAPISIVQPSCGSNAFRCSDRACCTLQSYCANSTLYCGSACQGGPCDEECDASRVCSDGGCCSEAGYCGTTYDFCGPGCRSGPCTSSSPAAPPLQNTVTRKKKGSSIGIYVGIAVPVVAALLGIFFAVLVVCHRRRRRQRMYQKNELVKPDSQINSLNDDGQLRMPGKRSIRLSFDALQAATNQFTEELGRGAFGVVYKGKLADGREIAVKKLLDNEQGLKDFEAETRTLGTINHANLVALLGFCFESNQPYVIYEYMSNGSLNEWVFDEDKTDRNFVLPWKTRVNVVKGTAKGLAYLHEDLQIGQTIIHLDIKPENILLDESFVPKVGDFGLAKLLGEHRTKTLAFGGTVGYMAPEVFAGASTTKMDVYSFGMVLLEVLSGRRHLNRALSRDSAYLPAWAIRKVVRGEALDVIDPLLELTDVDAEEATRLIVVALLCLQRDPDERPEMSNVLRMIEGFTTPKLPPTLQSELEMTERLVRKVPIGGQTIRSHLISFSGGAQENAESCTREGSRQRGYSPQRPLLPNYQSSGLATRSGRNQDSEMWVTA